MHNVDSAQMWLKYIDFETTRNNLAVVNLLCWMALEQPMVEGQRLLEKYTETLNSLLKDIIGSFESTEQKTLLTKYKDKQNEIAYQFSTFTASELANSKTIIDQILKPMLATANAELEKRKNFEIKCNNQGDIQDWKSYIEFEIKEEKYKRAKHLYERALGSSASNLDLWLTYIKFLQDHVKDASLVRAMFEQKLKHSKHLSPKEKVRLMIENGLYEEQ